MFTNESVCVCVCVCVTTVDACGEVGPGCGGAAALWAGVTARRVPGVPHAAGE